ncbi:putative inactive lipase [Gordonia insulae]|uniref:Putative inactive lipase n=2 Tax=Gordonia insulae TaxID=2420509 RepID=A0A3G8JM28_9ACTN|nr:putative inactive lipase [Gordonia insulae]
MRTRSYTVALRFRGGALALGVAALLVAAPPGPATGEPPNMMPVPPQVPHAINGAVPPPPFPRLSRIPLRAQAKGFGHRVLELREAILPSATGDPMFDRWPADLSSMQPGQVIATRDVTGTAAPVVTAPIARARLVKFRSTDATGAPSFGTATVLVPRTPHRGGPRPILVNNLPIDSLGTACNPGYTLAHGFSIATNVTDLLPPTTQLALARGYGVIIPDHQGPRMAYAEPVVAGHVVLDAIRATLALDPKAFGRSRIAMTGYSGGAIATNGATKLLGSYAPELAQRVVGAALGGVPADFRLLVGSMNANLATGIFHAATFGIARERTEILPLANDFAQWLATSPLKNVCTIPAAIAGQTFWPMQLLSSDPDPFHSPVAERIYRVTRMSDRKSVVPLYIYQGTHEWWIPAAGARALYREQCRLGARAAYREVFGEHVSAAVIGYPAAIDWLDRRLRGVPAPDECR